ncbi:hypothetical protein ACM26W_10750 [Halomonas sp. HK25]|uniref:hypothetical protein n=1 Tax=Halomonas sp. HK25 TaxID=3394321 RepID=UPI0039FC29F3
MKQQTHRKPMDEREKLRQFRELDDAFAEALRELDGPDVAPDTSVESPLLTATSPQEDEAPDRDHFEDRLRALMQEYHQPADQVAGLLQTLKTLGRIA